jgi:hypothetical protein
MRIISFKSRTPGGLKIDSTVVYTTGHVQEHSYNTLWGAVQVLNVGT